ncbi:MAG: DUF2970 domain-containing protein [Pseudomonadota bacterium]
MLTTTLNILRAVLWSFVGLGGRRADATVRLEQVRPLPLIAVAFAVVVVILGGLAALAHYAAHAAA